MFLSWNRILAMICGLASHDGMIESVGTQTWFHVMCNSDNFL